MQPEGKLYIETTEVGINGTTTSLTIFIEKKLALSLPLCYAGGDLGLGNAGRPWIHFSDATGKLFLTHSVEWLLANIDNFAEGRDRDQPLACAALHYGMDVCALFGRDQMCDVRTPSGEVLLTEVSYEVASWAAEEYMGRPEWTIDLHIRYLRRFKPATRDNRRQGPLVLLHCDLSSSHSDHIAIRSHFGCCYMTLEEALHRIDQFSHVHQAELMADLKNYYQMDEQRGNTTRVPRATLTVARRARLLRTRPTQMLWARD